MPYESSMNLIVVRAAYDPDAKVWWVEDSAPLNGLNIEAATIDELRDKLPAAANAGCVFRRHGRGDHDIWYSPIRNQNFVVPIWIMSRHTAVKVLRDAGFSEPS
jgi:hypothetical protein